MAVGFALTACGTVQTRSGTSAGGSATGTTSLTTSTSASAGLVVSPAHGRPHTTFTIAFTAPASTEPHRGRGAGVGARTGYTASVIGGSASGDCAGPRSVAIGAATKGLPVSLALDPARLGAWCPGVHTARVIEIETPVCNPGTMCPQYVRVIGTVGVARFTVGP